MTADAKNPTDRGALFGALAKAREACAAAPKDGNNTHHKYRYASAEAVIGEARAALSGSGLALVPTMSELRDFGGDPVLGRRFLLSHESGASVEIEHAWPVCPAPGRPADKAVAIADTSGLAYLLRDLLLMQRVDETDDMDHDGRENKPARAPEPRPAPAVIASAPPPPARNDARVLERPATAQPVPQVVPAAPPPPAAPHPGAARIRAKLAGLPLAEAVLQIPGDGPCPREVAKDLMGVGVDRLGSQDAFLAAMAEVGSIAGKPWTGAQVRAFVVDHLPDPKPAPAGRN